MLVVIVKIGVRNLVVCVRVRVLGHSRVLSPALRDFRLTHLAALVCPWEEVEAQFNAQLNRILQSLRQSYAVSRAPNSISSNRRHL